MDALEAKKQELLKKLKNVAITDGGNATAQLHKMELLHKRINAIVRFQNEALPVPPTP